MVTLCCSDCSAAALEWSLTQARTHKPWKPPFSTIYHTSRWCQVICEHSMTQKLPGTKWPHQAHVEVMNPELCIALCLDLSLNLEQACFQDVAGILPHTDFSYLNYQHPVSFPDPYRVWLEEVNHPTSLRACFCRPCICKARAYVGDVHRDVLFSSDRTSKASACCFTAEAPRGILTSGRQGLYLFPPSVSFPTLFLASPNSTPTLFLLPGPHVSPTASESPQL